jgi:hypothetical protein
VWGLFTEKGRFRNRTRGKNVGRRNCEEIVLRMPRKEKRLLERQGIDG